MIGRRASTAHCWLQFVRPGSPDPEGASVDAALAFASLHEVKKYLVNDDYRIIAAGEATFIGVAHSNYRLARAHAGGPPG